jgi:hypothetical protein
VTVLLIALFILWVLNNWWQIYFASGSTPIKLLKEEGLLTFLWMSLLFTPIALLYAILQRDTNK